MRFYIPLCTLMCKSRDAVAAGQSGCCNAHNRSCRRNIDMLLRKLCGICILSTATECHVAGVFQSFAANTLSSDWPHTLYQTMQCLMHVYSLPIDRHGDYNVITLLNMCCVAAGIKFNIKFNSFHVEYAVLRASDSSASVQVAADLDTCSSQRAAYMLQSCDRLGKSDSTSSIKVNS